MKTSTLPLYIFTATLFALPAPEKARPAHSSETGPRMQEMIKRFDKDSDGKLNDTARRGP
jgi:hypothetical protein